MEPSIVRLRVIGGEQSIDGDGKLLVTTGVVISEDGEILTSQLRWKEIPKPFSLKINRQTHKRHHRGNRQCPPHRTLEGQEGGCIPAVTEENESVEIGQWAIALGRFYWAESSSVSVGISIQCAESYSWHGEFTDV